VNTGQKVLAGLAAFGLGYGGYKLVTSGKSQAKSAQRAGFVMALVDSSGNPVTTAIAGQPVTAIAHVTNQSTLNGQPVAVDLGMRLNATYQNGILGQPVQFVTVPAGGTIDVSWSLTFPTDALASLGMLDCQGLIDSRVLAEATLDFVLASMTQRLYAGDSGNAVVYQGSTTDPATALASILGSVRSVWDATGTHGYSPTAPPYANNLPQMVTGQIYVIFVNQDCDWAERRSHELVISPGTNFLSYRGPKMPISEAMASIASYIISIAYFDGASQNYKMCNPNAPSWASDFSNLEWGRTYGIVMSQTQTWQYQTLINPARSFTEHLYGPSSAWNLVTYNGVPTDPATALASVISSGVVVTVWWWDNANQVYHGFKSNVPTYANDLNLMQTGEAFWIQVSSDCDWTYQAVA